MLFSWLYISQAIACSCPPPGKSHAMRLESYKNSSVIFTGVVIEVNQSQVAFIVSEMLKGDLADSVFLSTTESCSVFPKKNEEWIIYAKNDERGLLTASQCLLSRRIDTVSHKFNPPIPPPPNADMDKIRNPENENDIQIADKLELLDEIGWLRAKRSIQETDRDRESPEVEGRDYSLVHYAVLLISVLSFLMLLIVLFRMK